MSTTTTKSNLPTPQEKGTPIDKFEFRYLEERLGVTREQVRNAVDAVGPDRREVIAYLTKNKKWATVL
ncbi:MAG TPA: DUF3606 domain-containing protein [Puia sp.]|jgi:hypothetical protein